VKFEPKKILIGAASAFVLLTVWNQPQEAGESTGNFISDAGSWVQDAFDKVNEFSKNVIE
jgi:hypothetical protein